MAAGRAPALHIAPVNLVFISSSLGVGGAETMLYRLATRIDASRFRVGVVSLTDKGEVGTRLESAGIDVTALNLVPGRIPWYGIRRLLDVLDAFEADLLQGWMYHGNLAASFAGWTSRRRCPVLWGVRHSLDDIARERPLTRAVIRACAHVSWQPAAAIYNSHRARRQHEAAGFVPNDAVVIPNGFELAGRGPRRDLRKRFGLAADRILIGMVARHHLCKGHAEFLKAAAQVARRHPETSFVMIGREVNSGNRPLTRLITSLGIADSVRLLDERRDAPQLIACLDVLCSASVWGEAFPNVVGEAMAAGIPCVATDVGDAGEILGDTGITVPPGDARALATAMARFVECGPAGRARLGAAARRRVAERYDLETVVRQYERLYEEVSERVRHRRAL